MTTANTLSTPCPANTNVLALTKNEFPRPTGSEKSWRLVLKSSTFRFTALATSNEQAPTQTVGFAQDGRPKARALWRALPYDYCLRRAVTIRDLQLDLNVPYAADSKCSTSDEHHPGVLAEYAAAPNPLSVSRRPVRHGHAMAELGTHHLGRHSPPYQHVQSHRQRLLLRFGVPIVFGHSMHWMYQL